ncbi:hypothetical protein HW555_009585 [Spodoptera exigua]|uniref:ALMS motif domain-containing protein n=1 Tax=Spodoptera exigua TaxID=7107 RepID=A0A835G8W7_SPOEX|nr:hypothetical protein HW555_009585 [Spodoptera exigua]
MERDEIEKNDAGSSNDVDSRGAVNSLILDYYKKFGRKRDLEQFFSLSTAQSDIKDTSGLFWRKMKSENDSSDSGGRKSDSSQEVCRISIRCSLPEPTSSQEDDEQKTKTDSPHTESPPIIIEEVPADRKLEWDSLADVGYANESDRKNSASSLSTLERLALKQQYTNNDSKQEIGIPTSHSTPIDENDNKSKIKKGIGKKTKFYKKDVDFVEVNVPHTSDANPPPSINVNLTKHISFNVERDGGVTIDNVKKDVSISSPEKVSVDTSYVGMDKEIQTTLPLNKPEKKEKSSSPNEAPKPVDPYNQKIPVMISLNTLRKRLRKKKARNVRRKLRVRKQKEVNKDETPQEKSGAQLSEAESFEYMPGHVYNQNKLKDNAPILDNSAAGNKSSLESSGLTTDSSKRSKHSLTKDLEQCVELLKHTLQKRYDDGNIKKKLIKDIVERLVNSKYRNDYNSDFLSGISSKRLGMIGNNTTTSTSDANNTEDSTNKKPKKSILRSEKFNANVVASTSQSAPNLFSASIEKVTSNLIKPNTSNTESDVSSKEKTSSDNGFPKTSSEELYLRYLEALRREEAYKRHLKDKEMFLKQKLVKSDTSFKVPVNQEAKMNRRMKDLMKDLTRNNYDDGSGDASKLEGGSSTNLDIDRLSAVRSQRSHSVFTLSSSHSDALKRPNLKKKIQAEREIDEAGPSQGHYCCCPHHYLNAKTGFSDNSVQVNIKNCDAAVGMPCQGKGKDCVIMLGDNKKSNSECPKNTCVAPDSHKGDIKYVCLCGGKQVSSSEVGDNFMIYRCCKLTNRGIQPEDPSRINTAVQCGSCEMKDDKIELLQPPCRLATCTDSSSTDNTSNPRRHSRASQTNMLINMCLGMNNYQSSGSDIKKIRDTTTKSIVCAKKHFVTEATRCLQTEISINPQISDPRLSDINIISNNDCARLISEQRRRVSVYSTESEGVKTFSDVSTNSTSDKFLIQSEGSLCKSDVTSKQNSEDKESRKSSLVGKDYTIPIHGTNMTLTVNLGANNVKNTGPNEAGVVTEKISQADQETLAICEVSKSAQCCLNPECSNSANTNSKTDAAVSTKTSCCLKNISSGSTYNTYPMETVKEKSPFKRSNTDTDNKLSTNTSIQTDPILTKGEEINNNQGTRVDIRSSKFNTFEKISQVERSRNINVAKTKEVRIDSNTTDINKTSRDRSEIRQADFCSLNSKKIDNSRAENSKSNKNESKIDSDKAGYCCNTEKTDDTRSEDTRSSKNESKTDAYKGDCCDSNSKKTDSTRTGSIKGSKNESRNDNSKADYCKCKTDSPKSDNNCFAIEKVSVGVQKDLSTEQTKNVIIETDDIHTKNVSVETECRKEFGSDVCCQTDRLLIEDMEKSSFQEKIDVQANTYKTIDSETKDKKLLESRCQNSDCPNSFNSKGPIIDVIQDITRRYSKKDVLKIKKNKCFSEIITVLNYLLETDDSTDPDRKCSTSTGMKSSSDQGKRSKLSDTCSERMVDKSVQLSCKKSSKESKACTDTSDLPCSSDLPTTSSDSAACKVLNKIKKECEKFHQKVKCKGRKCEVSSSTSINCEKCKKVHHCACRSHKCKRSKAFEKLQKKCIAYNLIIQTSESMLSEETMCENKSRPLKNVVLKVPKNKGKKECCYKGDQESRRTSPQRSPKCSKNRTKSGRRESETSDDFSKRIEMATVREYLEQNRPDFVKNTSQRQDCLKFISERRANERAAKRDLLSLHVEKQPDLTSLTSEELRQLAKDIGLDLRKKRKSPKASVAGQQFDAFDKEEVPFFVSVHHVTSLEPFVLSQHFSCRLWIVVVAL